MSSLSILLLAVFLLIPASWYLFEYFWDRRHLRHHPEKGEVRNIRARKAKRLRTQHPEIPVIDVRLRQAHEEGHLRGAINAPFGLREGRFDGPGLAALAELDHEAPVLVYCDGGFRSRMAVPTLREAGFRTIYHLHRGMLSWKLAGGEVEEGSGGAE